MKPCKSKVGLCCIHPFQKFTQKSQSDLWHHCDHLLSHVLLRGTGQRREAAMDSKRTTAPTGECPGKFGWEASRGCEGREKDSLLLRTALPFSFSRVPALQGRPQRALGDNPAHFCCGLTQAWFSSSSTAELTRKPVGDTLTGGNSFRTACLCTSYPEGTPISALSLLGLISPAPVSWQNQTPGSLPEARPEAEPR